ncbi:MAG: hypothetical protein FJ291_07745 [Planctomycetes bacterium]|nr:hypothetical protein [Planctomycetota bacterium]
MTADWLLLEVGGAGLLAARAQGRRLRRASLAIREPLERLVPLLEKEAATYHMMQGGYAAAAKSTAEALWDTGFGAPHPILQRHIGDLGLVYEQARYAEIVAKLDAPSKEKLKRAVVDVMSYRLKRQIQLRNAALDAQIGAMRALIASHRELEKGKPISLATVAAYVQSMRELVEQLAAAAKKK